MLLVNKSSHTLLLYTPMSDTTTTPPTDASPVNVKTSLFEIFSVGSQVAAPVELMPGIHLHHNDKKTSDLRDAYRKHLKETEDGPIQRAASLSLHTHQSFSSAVISYRDSRTKVFAYAPKRTISCVFDFREDLTPIPDHDDRQIHPPDGASIAPTFLLRKAVNSRNGRHLLNG